MNAAASRIRNGSTGARKRGVSALTSSAVDVWVKRVPQLVINGWYMLDNYHSDHGEGGNAERNRHTDGRQQGRKAAAQRRPPNANRRGVAETGGEAVRRSLRTLGARAPRVFLFAVANDRRLIHHTCLGLPDVPGILGDRAIAGKLARMTHVLDCPSSPGIGLNVKRADPFLGIDVG